MPWNLSGGVCHIRNKPTVSKRLGRDVKIKITEHNRPGIPDETITPEPGAKIYTCQRCGIEVATKAVHSQAKYCRECAKEAMNEASREHKRRVRARAKELGIPVRKYAV